MLVLSSSHSALPAGIEITKGILTALPADVGLYNEYLDSERFSGIEHLENMRRFIGEKYADKPIKVVMALGPQALEFMREYGDEIFPSVPVVYSGVRKERIHDNPPPPNYVGIESRFDLAATVELALALQAEAKELVVVTGAAEFDKAWEATAKAELGTFASRLKLRYLSGLAMDDLLTTVAQLPTDSIVLYLTVYQDGSGRRFIPRDVAARLSQAAGAPVYSVYDTYLGLGIVGGYMDTFEAVGVQAGSIARRILEGENPAEMTIDPNAGHSYRIDWRQLQRWGLDQANLPADAEIRYRPPSLWEQYRELVLAAVIVFALQSMLITALLIERHRRRRAEGSLREGEERIALAAQSANLGLWQWDLVRDRLWVTDLCRALLGIAPDTALSMSSLLDVVSREDRKGLRKTIEKLRSTDKMYESEFRITLPDGEIRWIGVTGRSTFDARGKALRMTGVLTDLTERKRIVEKLRESEERYRNVVETQTELICRYLPDTTLTFVNDTYCRYFGKSREELIGNRFIEFVPESARLAALRYVESIGSKAPIETYEHEVLRPDGSVGWQQWVDRAIFDSTGKTVEIQGIGRDVTELKNAESEAQQRREEVMHLTRVAVLGELSGALAHELNQPLAAILSDAQAARRMISGHALDLGNLTEILDDIVADDNRAGAVIKRLRALLKRGDQQSAPHDINEIVTDVLQFANPELVARRVAVQTDFAPSLPSILGDRVQLQQVLLNLILNGCEAMFSLEAAARRLKITTSSNGNGLVEARVSDHGTGIEPSTLERIFEPFVTTKKSGLGLGLSICRSIITSHGGLIWAQNNPDRGATLGFAIPGTVGESIADRRSGSLRR
ncbi:PAS domain S-box protein [Mesorhizobium sp. WSM2239]|uniref:histidine kinase n=2 Tax=unclassified Mesorhizobium TaxID=325217 RepID=A0AAU8D7I7_9HYPH